LWLDLLDLFRFNDNVFILAELVALDDLVAIHDHVLEWADVLLLHPLLVWPMQHVERNSRTARAGKQSHRHGDKSKS